MLLYSMMLKHKVPHTRQAQTSFHRLLRGTSVSSFRFERMGKGVRIIKSMVFVLGVVSCLFLKVWGMSCSKFTVTQMVDKGSIPIRS